MTAQIDDVNGLLKSIFSPSDVDMFASVMDHPGDIEKLRIAAALASQVPARTLAFTAGMAGGKPFFQLAASMPENVRDKLKLVADGKAAGTDLVTVLAGEGALMLAAGIQPAVQQGAKGPYYSMGPGSPVFAAKDDLLLIALSPQDLEDSLSAAEDAGKRLAVKRRYESPNFYQVHADFPSFAAFAKEQEGVSEPGASHLDAVSGLFQAPVELEIAFESKPGSFLVSSYINALEAVKDAAARFKDLKPAKGANLFLAGGGKLLFALGSPIEFKAAEWRIYPEFSEMWDAVLPELQKRNITEKDMEDFLTGDFTVAFGSDAAFGGRKIPGGYAALRGRPGAAEKILRQLTADEEFKQAFPLVPVESEGWSSLFMAGSAFLPVPVLVGVKGDTFFIGAVEPQELGKEPQLPEAAEALLNTELFAGGFLDTASIWERVKQEFADPASPLVALLGLNNTQRDEELRNSLQGILNSTLSVPFVKVWASDLESSHMEFTVADVPPENRLLPKLLASMTLSAGSATDAAEASNIVSDLRSLKAASLMYYADNIEAINEGEVPFEIKHLSPYMDNPQKFEQGFHIAVKDGKRWWVGFDLNAAGKPQGVRQKLSDKANSVGLLGERSADVPYAGQDIVWMIAR